MAGTQQDPTTSIEEELHERLEGFDCCVVGISYILAGRQRSVNCAPWKKKTAMGTNQGPIAIRGVRSTTIASR